MIALASDHAGFALKEQVKQWLADWGEFVFDHGCFSESSVDYPDYAAKALRAMLTCQADRGILICGSGIGMSITANRFKGIRAALVNTVETAKLCRQHNNANVLVLAGRTTPPEIAKEIVKAWLKTPFEGGRHRERLEKIDRIADEIDTKPCL